MSAKIFGAEGRGVISYGSSLLASIGIIFSLNLGRSFLSETCKNETEKFNQIPYYLGLNNFAIFLTIALATLYWLFSPTAQEFLSGRLLVANLACAAYFVWSINGNALFASFQKTFLQELIILGTRGALLIFLIVYLCFGNKDLGLFLVLYSFILELAPGSVRI